MPPTQIIRCDCVSLLACNTATMTHRLIAANAPMTMRARITRSGNSRQRYRFMSDARMDWTVTTPLAGIGLVAGEANGLL
jgi:hypothetical protein